MQKRYGWKIIKKSLKSFLVTEHFFGLNIIIKPMKIIDNKDVKGYSESFKCQLFNGENRLWKLFMSTEIYVKNKSWKNHRKFPLWVTFRIITFFAQVIEIESYTQGSWEKFLSNGITYQFIQFIPGFGLFWPFFYSIRRTNLGNIDYRLQYFNWFCR